MGAGRDLPPGGPPLGSLVAQPVGLHALPHGVPAAVGAVSAAEPVGAAGRGRVTTFVELDGKGLKFVEREPLDGPPLLIVSHSWIFRHADGAVRLLLSGGWQLQLDEMVPDA